MKMPVPMSWLAVMLMALFLVPMVAPAQEAPPPHDAQPQGALSGARIFVSAGHGWYYNGEQGRWMTQRGVTNDLLEDFCNAESVNQYLVPMLWNAGASVWTVRERDLQTNEVIVHHSDAAQCVLEGEWELEDRAGAWSGTQLATRSTTGEPDAVATFAPDIPATGMYAVYVRYAPSETSRRGTSTSTRFLINHSGGTRVWVQDQNHHHSTWTYIGHYHFEAGQNPARGSVVVTNQTERRGEAVVVNAVRFGGGMGTAVRGGSTSGKPRWEESGLYYGEYVGMNKDDSDTRTVNTVSAMPLYSEWELENWEKGRGIYVAWHGNASGQPGGPARGLFTFVYSPNSWEGVENFTGYPGGDVLGTSIHNGIIRTIHGVWDETWRNGPVVCRWLGETNPRNNGRMPAALTEVGFFDNATDAKWMLDPRFRRLAARGYYHGLVDYYSSQVEGMTISTYLPEPPRELRAIQQGDTVRLAWLEPAYAEDRSLGDRPTGYRVYRSLNGYGFDAGTDVRSTSISLRDLPQDRPIYLRVTAVNEGGESMPSEVVAVRNQRNIRPEVLLVHGFHRLDGDLNSFDERGASRGILERMNTFDYAVQHGDALAAAGVRFDSVSSAAIARGQVTLTPYRTVVWMAGREGGSEPLLTDSQIRALTGYLQSGGSLLISAAHIGTEFENDDVGRQFLNQVLGARFDGIVENAKSAAPVSSGILQDLGVVEFGGLVGRSYPLPAVETLRPMGEAAAMLNLEGANSGAVGIQQSNVGRSIVLTVPFEIIDEAPMRAAIMQRALDFLGAREASPSQLASSN
jgi:hypothetical protein